MRPFVVLMVWDPSSAVPVVKSPGLDDEGGRGLHLVEALATKWGHRWLTGGGKVVWCTFARSR